MWLSPCLLSENNNLNKNSEQNYFKDKFLLDIESCMNFFTCWFQELETTFLTTNGCLENAIYSVGLCTRCVTCMGAALLVFLVATNWRRPLTVCSIFFLQANSASSAWRTWSTRSSPWVLPSRKPTTSSGPSSWTPPTAAGRRRTTTSSTAETMATEKTKLTICCEEWSRFLEVLT